MDRLRVPTFAGPGSPGSRPASGTALRRLSPSDPLPKISCPSTDVDIPRSAWSTWVPAEGPRELRRALTGAERRELEARRDELAPALAGTDDADRDRVMLAVVDMFGSFRSMRQTGEEAFAVAESTYRALAEFPPWAVVKVCLSIQQNGVWRDGKFDRVWPPNDPEVAEAVRKEISFYAARHREVVALLAAKVERPPGEGGGEERAGG